mmetsp:Transcript_8848/g.26582  ORF Transcript_8848/g.26582 Transcript_8848/m.26582 type:complete len:241 (+) Transcript_8848:94-816(+)
MSARTVGVVIGRSVWVERGSQADSLHRSHGIGTGNLSRGELTYGRNIEDKSRLGRQERATREGDSQHEHLQMPLHEAYYAAFLLGGMEIYDNDMCLLDERACWNVFTRLDENFTYAFRVYHHFRSKGWVARCGLKAGTDFVLYDEKRLRTGHVHSTALVLVVCVPWRPRLATSALLAAERVAASTKRQLVLAEVSCDSARARCSLQDTLEHMSVTDIVISFVKAEHLARLRSKSVQGRTR